MQPGSDTPNTEARITEARITQELGDLPGFVLSAGALRVRYRFADFERAFAFMSAVAADAEAQGHHPDWSNSYATVAIALRTHDASAVTAKDVALARSIVARAAAHGGEVLPPAPAASPGAQPAYPRDIPPMWFLLSLLLMAGLWLLWPEPRWLPLGARVAGAVVMLLGLGLVLWGAGLFRRLGTGVRPFTEALRVVDTGPFRWTRNPMYLGMVAMLVGAAMAFATPWPWLVVPPFAVLLHRRFILREEQFMAARFGDAFRDYCRRVRRWL